MAKKPDKLTRGNVSCMQVTLQVVEEHAAGVVDQVNAYFGMRKIEVAPDFKGAPRIMLNGKVEMNIGMLDQGFWPDGLYTAPSGIVLALWPIASEASDRLDRQLRLLPEISLELLEIELPSEACFSAILLYEISGVQFVWKSLFLSRAVKKGVLYLA